MGPKNFLAAIVFGTALAAGIFATVLLSKPAELRTAFVIPSPGKLPEFSLRDQSGDIVNPDTFRDQWDLVFFGFTNCPDICPTTLQVLANARRELADSGSKIIPRIVLVSVDPERDTGDVLGRYVDYFGADNLGVTGELAELIKLTAALGIYFEKAGIGDGNYTVNHSPAVLLINPDAEFSALFSGPHVADDFVHDIPIITGSE
jgi:protein SCO1/2